MTRKSLFSTLCLLLFVAKAPCSSGEFEVVNVWYNTYPSNVTTEHIRVAANALYVGPVDSNDLHALLQTEACTVKNNRPPEICASGLGINDTNGPWPVGYIITCNTPQCMGQQYISKPCCGQGNIDFRGKAGVTIYHQFGPDIHQKVGHNQAVECQSCGGCGEGGSAGAALVLPIRHEALHLQQSLAPLASDFTLERVDVRSEATYLMDEWALVSADPSVGPFGRVTSSSSFPLSTWLAAQNSAKPPSLTAVVTSDPQWAALVVLAPPHPDKERAIPLPEAKLHRSWLPGTTESGLVAVRIDYSPERVPVSLEVLHQEGPIGPREIAFVRDNLHLSYRSNKPHRVVLYAVIRFGQEVRIEVSRTLLPECCGPWPGWNPPPWGI